MKANSSTRRLWNLRLTIAFLALVALASFDLWAGGYCYRHRARTFLQPAGSPPVSNGSAGHFVAGQLF